jgi:hypothetical protein
MGDGHGHGWTDNGRQVFDPELLEQAAGDLRKQNTGQQLQSQLLDSLIPAAVFSPKVPGATEVASRLRESYQAMMTQLSRVGVDLSDLAARTLAAAQVAREVDPVTQAQARAAQHHHPD